jgi:hypothetical protein
MLQKSGRVRPKVDNDVMDCPTDTANEFGLKGRGHLVVENAEGAFTIIATDVALDEVWAESMGFELAIAEGPEEKASIVGGRVGLDEEGSVDGGGSEFHEGLNG